MEVLDDRRDDDGEVDGFAPGFRALGARVVEKIDHHDVHPRRHGSGAPDRFGRQGRVLQPGIVLGELEKAGERREGVAKIVADLAGEVEQLLVGTSKLLGGASEFEHVDDPIRERVEGAALVLLQLPRLVVEHAERADRDARRGDHRARRVQAHSSDLTGHERVVREAGILSGIHDLHVPRLVQDHGAHRVLAGADLRLEPHRGDLVLEAVVDDVDHCAGDAADHRGELRDAREVRMRDLPDDPVLRDRISSRDGAVDAHAVPHVPPRHCFGEPSGLDAGGVERVARGPPTLRRGPTGRARWRTLPLARSCQSSR